MFGIEVTVLHTSKHDPVTNSSHLEKFRNNMISIEPKAFYSNRCLWEKKEKTKKKQLTKLRKESVAPRLTIVGTILNLPACRDHQRLTDNENQINRCQLLFFYQQTSRQTIPNTMTSKRIPKAFINVRVSVLSLVL